MFTERRSLIVWVNDYKSARSLERFGLLHYISKKMKYAVLYFHAERENEVYAQLKKLPYVRKIEPSYRHELKTEYSKSNVDKRQSYTH